MPATPSLVSLQQNETVVIATQAKPPYTSMHNIVHLSMEYVGIPSDVLGPSFQYLECGMEYAPLIPGAI